MNIKNLSDKPQKFVGGHRMCSGCGAPIIVRQVLMAAEDQPVVTTCATGCLEVATSIYPYTNWAIPWIHSAFGNAAATISGIESMYKALKKEGDIKKEIKFIAFAGDGGTFDIGLQALSGALERGHNFVYVCYNNEAYMNTGYQRSSATPSHGATSTTPIGKKVKGKIQRRKRLTEIVEAHGINYLAQGSPGYYNDLIKKAKKAFETDGPSFLNVIQPCIPGWQIEPALTMEIAKLAVETCYWPLYEVENGNIKINIKPRVKKPLVDFLKTQGRFKHLFKPENKELLIDLQLEVNRQWDKLLRREQFEAEEKAA